jgi:CDP-paratose 2-epimerase
MYNHALVTGGAGFVGAALSIALRRDGICSRVTALDNLHRRGSELNLDRLARAGVAFLHGDIRSTEDLALQNPPDLLVECSAEPSAQAGYGGSPEYLIQTNLQGCFNCLELARRAHSDFVFVSTSRVYPYKRLNEISFVEEETRFSLTPEQTIPGASGAGIGEAFPLDGPRSLYGMTKLAAELMVEEYADAYGLRVIINRCGLLTGPWQMAKSDQGVIALWMAAHYFGRDLRYIGFNGTGKQVRDFLHVDDLSALLLLQLKDFDRYRGRVFNVGGGLRNSLSLRECTALCEEITGKRIQIPSVAENRPADVRSYITDTTRISEASGWSPCRDARATLTDIYRWIQAEETRVKPLLVG